MRPTQGFEEQGNKDIYFRGNKRTEVKKSGNQGTNLGNREYGK